MIDVGVGGPMYQVSNDLGSLPCDTLNSALGNDVNTAAPKLIAAIKSKSTVSAVASCWDIYTLLKRC